MYNIGISIISRNAIIVSDILLVIYFGWKRQYPVVPRKWHTRLALSGLSVAVIHVTMFAKIEVIPLGNADAVTHVTATILSVMATMYVLREKVPLSKRLGIMLLLIGTCFIVVGLWDSVNHSNSLAHENHENGTQFIAMMHLETNKDHQAMKAKNTSVTQVTNANAAHRAIITNTTSGLLLGFALCFIQGLFDFLEVYFASTLKEHVEDEDPLIINFWNVTASLLFSLTCMLIFEYDELAIPTNNDDAMYFTIHIITAGVAQVLYVYLVKFLSLIAMSIIIYSEIPMKTLSQYLIVPELQPITGGIFDLAGCLIITVGLVIPFIPALKCTNEGQETAEESPEEKLLRPG